MRLQDIRDMSKDDILATLGLASKPTTGEWLLGTIGIFGIGVLVGASAALLLAPKAGTDLRQDLGRRISEVRNRAMNTSTGTERPQGSTENSFG
jgi:gas vesicle protein